MNKHSKLLQINLWQSEVSEGFTQQQMNPIQFITEGSTSLPQSLPLITICSHLHHYQIPNIQLQYNSMFTCTSCTRNETSQYTEEFTVRLVSLIHQNISVFIQPSSGSWQMCPHMKQWVFLYFLCYMLYSATSSTHRKINKLNSNDTSSHHKITAHTLETHKSIYLQE